MPEPLGSTVVRRTDFDRHSSVEERYDFAPTLEALLRKQFESSYLENSSKIGIYEATDEAIDEATHGPVSAIASQESLNGNDETYDFRLFAQPLGPRSRGALENAVSRIVLKSPTPNDEPGFVVPRRPQAYYFTGVPSVQQREQFQQAAISGEAVISGLGMKWKGLQLPWRVTTIKSQSPTEEGRFESLPLNASEKKRRSGKKKRIAIRKKYAAKAATESAARQILAKKEAAAKEKRTRKNREKKVKKRQRDKLKEEQKGHELG